MKGQRVIFNYFCVGDMCWVRFKVKTFQVTCVLLYYLISEETPNSAKIVYSSFARWQLARKQSFQSLVI